MDYTKSLLKFTDMKWLSLFILGTLTAFRINAAFPVADFSYYIEFIGAGADVSFLNESTDGETFFWDFGDGATSTELHPFHHYDLPGIYVVCLTATNPSGSDTFCDSLITYYAPSADFTFSGDPTVSFTDLSTNFPTTWNWFFGDGDTTSVINPVHTFLENGDYNVCLSVGNPGGTNYTCKTVTISSYPVTEAAFTFSGDPSVAFTDNSTLDPFAWHWDFGDGDTSIEQNPAHTYTDNGTFSVCLTATNAGGSNTVCEEVNIIYAYPFPEADFTYLIIDLGAAFADASTNDPISWHWDFGDGDTSNEKNPVHLYAADGNYTVCLTATNIGGPDTACKDLFLALGISSAQEEPIKVFPNPSSGHLIMQFNKILLNGTCCIFNALGNCVMQTNELHTNFLQLNIEKLPAGIYSYIIYEDDDKSYTGTFIRQ